jgi:hypothetical protein
MSVTPLGAAIVTPLEAALGVAALERAAIVTPLDESGEGNIQRYKMEVLYLISI